MEQNFDIAAEERPVVEAAIGSATIDKLRGEQASLIDAYNALGGQNQASMDALCQYQAGFSSMDVSSAVSALSGEGDISATFADIPAIELSLVERAIGAAVLGKLEGNPTLMSEAYSRIGGDSPQSFAAFRQVDPLFARGDPQRLAS